MKRLDKIQAELPSLSYMELENLEKFVKDLRMRKWQEERELRNKKYLKGVEQRERAQRAYQEIAFEFRQFLRDTLVPGDIIRCKGYSKHKKLVEFKGDWAISLCGWYRKNEFQSNGYGSENHLDYVTHVLRNGKFEKTMDLFKQSQS